MSDQSPVAEAAAQPDIELGLKLTDLRKQATNVIFRAELLGAPRDNAPNNFRYQRGHAWSRSATCVEQPILPDGSPVAILEWATWDVYTTRQVIFDYDERAADGQPLLDGKWASRSTRIIIGHNRLASGGERLHYLPGQQVPAHIDRLTDDEVCHEAGAIIEHLARRASERERQLGRRQTAARMFGRLLQLARSW